MTRAQRTWPKPAKDYREALLKCIPSMNWLGNFFSGVNEVFRKGDIDETLWENLEDTLLEADVGVPAAQELLSRLQKIVKDRGIKDSSILREVLKQEIASMLGDKPQPLNLKTSGTTVILAVGVNGSGKTTTIGKLAAQFKAQGKKVFLAAADTFRAAAIDQLEAWTRRAGAELIKHTEGADPAAVAFDAVKAAHAQKADIVIIDTAGRLQTKTNLMEELKKISRVIQKEIPDAPHETLLVLDSVTGQNALSQAKLFRQAVNVTGIVITKLDGSAKGGALLAIRRELDIPVKYIGMGEAIEDLRPFDPHAFAEALLSEGR